MNRHQLVFKNKNAFSKKKNKNSHISSKKVFEELRQERSLQRTLNKIINNNSDLFADFLVSKDTFSSEIDLDILIKEQQTDVILSQFIEILKKNNNRLYKYTNDLDLQLHDLPPHQRRLIVKTKFEKNLLWYIFENRETNKEEYKLFVPPKLKRRILDHYHNISNIHNGELRMLLMIKRSFYWYKMHMDIKQYCRTCEICQMSGSKRKNKKAGRLQLFPAQHFNEMIAVDLVGPLPVTIRNNKYLVTIIDRFTRYCRMIPISDIQALTVCKAILNEWFYRLGIPKKLLSDRGSQFTGEVMQTISHILGFKKLFTTAYHPQCDGMIERLHRWLKSKLRITASVQELEFEKGIGNWDDFINVIEFHYNNTTNRMTGFAPYELVFAHDPTDLLAISLRLNRGLYDLKDPNTKIYLQNLKDLLACKTLKATKSSEKYDNIRKRYYDKSHKHVKFNVGDVVILFIGDKFVGNKKKLLNLYDGPYIIMEKMGDVNYKIARVSNKNDLLTVHVSKLEKFYTDPSYYENRKITIPIDAFEALEN